MRIVIALSCLWIVANVVLFTGPELYGRWTGWYIYVNPGWHWYVWLLGPPVLLVLLGCGWRLLRRRDGGAAH